MSEPKFGFGDKVTFGANPAVKKIFALKREDDGFYYCSRDTEWIPEFAVKLYQEPKKKKLFAWSCPAIDEIVFTREDKKPAMLNLEYLRLPEYDLEYPEPKEFKQSDLYV
jgi:hypothetical protein